MSVSRCGHGRQYFTEFPRPVSDSEKYEIYGQLWASQVVLVVKNSPANVRDVRDKEFDP